MVKRIAGAHELIIRDMNKSEIASRQTVRHPQRAGSGN